MLHHLRECVSPYCYASSQTRNTHFIIIILFLHRACSDRIRVHHRYCLFFFFKLYLFIVRTSNVYYTVGSGGGWLSVRTKKGFSNMASAIFISCARAIQWAYGNPLLCSGGAEAETFRGQMEGYNTRLAEPVTNII